ncbi:MAG TPA: HEPN domain-containing protein [Gemmataceae bacterium]|nr:HEPN domain-containing protein [Gemmataceae bacterium]
MKRATRPWARMAEDDPGIAQIAMRNAARCYDGVCFHCQQCVEIYLRALLIESGLPVPKTHDLDGLLTLLLPTHKTLRAFRRGLLFLSSFAVEARYPGLNSSKRQALAAMPWAERVRWECRKVLGIKRP